MKIHSSDYVKYKVIEGKDGWLYLWDVDGLTEILSGETQHTDVQASIAARNIELRDHWCGARGIKYVHTISPDKASVYPQFLPDGVTYEPQGLLAKTTQYLCKSSATFVDSVHVARQCSKAGQAFFKTDSHWTYATAYSALREIMAPVTAQFPSARVLERDAIKSRDRETIMELAAILPNPASEKSEILAPQYPTSKKTFQTDSSRGRITIYENERRDLPRCVLFRDSFSTFYLDILKESFSRVVAINSRVFWYDFIEAEHPDVVIMQVAERFLDPLVTDLHVRTFEGTFNVKISDITENGGRQS